ncbi:MAG: HipA domain-containing protein [Saprospiraceae bacterium]
MKPKTQLEISVFADWKGLPESTLLGNLLVSPSRGKESFSFEYIDSWLQSGYSQMIDPDLQLFSGIYYPKERKSNFGVFLDSCPDRWGRLLMQRREAILARQEYRKPERLLESDFLLGVYDEHRMGALRFKVDPNGPFVNNNKTMPTPPWASLSELEYASLKFEEDESEDPDFSKWLSLLLAPGSSLGGARPKASVKDSKNNLWIAKFPSRHDEKDIGAWEMVVNQLALQSGINTPECKLQKFNSKYHTYLSRRFDRININQRIHFASAMTMLSHTDGEDSEGVSYLDLAEFIVRHSISVEKDLEELWRRIVFSICVKNTDDHLRNHGFLLAKNGWTLSPAYDINANEYGTNLSLNIDQSNDSLDIDVALNVSGYFRLSSTKANAIRKKIMEVSRNWKKVALRYKISKSEIERMEPAFSNY